MKIGDYVLIQKPDNSRDTYLAWTMGMDRYDKTIHRISIQINMGPRGDVIYYLLNGINFSFSSYWLIPVTSPDRNL